jgi:hypothetical protein
MLDDDKARWRLYQRLVERALDEPEFLAQLKQDPKGTLGAEGIHLTDEELIKIVEDSENVRHFIIPGIRGIIC